MAQHAAPHGRGSARVRRLALAVVAAALLAAALGGASSHALTTLPAPAGPTGIALDGRVDLAWQSVPGATGYTVYRGTSATAITTLLTPAAGVGGTAYSDSTAANGTTYFYAVRAVGGGAESPNSLTVQATPHPRACSTGNAVVLENCYPGDAAWNVRNPAQISSGGIEGFSTASSVNKGGSVDLKVNADDNSTFRIEIYRSGYYAGSGARLFSVIRGVRGVRQPACISDGNTGLIDCSNWSTSATITTTSAWPSGVYLLRLVRDDTGTDYQILLSVRDDARAADILYGVAFTNYQAYNNYGGKSLYDFNSFGNTTVAGTPRAVKVSFDRPFEQPRSGLRDWYTRNEFATVYWLEREGFDVSYIANNDLERDPSLALGHHAYIDPAHDEYWSSGMRGAVTAARDHGVGLFFTGSNEIYWRIRFEPSPVTGTAGRVEVTYKTTQGGVVDPSGIPTGTWRDPAGVNQPENALTGQMYVGDNDSTYFPLVVSAAQGSDRIWRYTGLDAQAPGTSTSIGTDLVGWEWDARAANGQEPAGVKVLAESPVTGELIQNFGRDYVNGSTTTTMVKYAAPSGALVVATGTNHWNRGLAKNADGAGTPDTRIQQATTNILEDMGALPQTPSGDITLDNPAGRPAAPTGAAAVALGTDSVKISWNAVAGASGYNVYRSLTPRQGGQPLGALANGSVVTGTTFTDIGLAAATQYYYVVTAVAGGVQSLASNEAPVTTAAAAGQPTRINAGGGAYTSLAGATFRADALFAGGSTFSAPTRAIAGTSDPALYRDERWGQFTYSIPVANGTYDVRFHFVELYYGTAQPGCAGKRIFGMDILDTPATPDIANLDICAAAGPNTALVRTVAGVTVTDGTLNIRSVYGSADDPEVAAIEVIPEAVAPAPPTVVDTTPLAGETGVSRLAQPKAKFSRALDPATITATSFTLSSPGGTAVPATVSYDAGSLQATLVPAAALAFSTTYTARVTTAVKALDGTALAADSTWTFTTADPVPPTVTSTFPADGATAISPSVPPRAVFSRSLDPSTINASSFTLTGPDGAVTATVAYDDSVRSATLTPAAPLAFSTTYTAHISTAVKAVDGVAFAAPFTWSFTTSAAASAPPAVTARSPGVGATGVSRATSVDATFSRDLDPATITATTFTLNGPAGGIDAAVTYDAGTKTAHLVPAAALAYSTTYTARLDSTIHATDGTALSAAVSWSFTTLAPPPPPTVTSTVPADGAAFVARAAAISATFSRALDPTTIGGSSFTLTGPNGAVAATVSYDATARVATLSPTTALDGGVTYTARIAATVTADDGTALAAPVSWSFSTAACPCSLFSPLLAPAAVDISTQDARTGTGPFSYELGVKVTVDQPMQLTALRFFKSPSETGTHTGRVWTTSGVQLASVVFTGETASGWQQQSLPTPLLLQAGTVYVVSVNANSYFVSTRSGLQTQVVSGPIRSVADGANGVYGAAAGTFPTQTFSSSNYFVDLQAVPDGDPAPPAVTSTTPAGGATGVSRTVAVKAVFSRSLDPSTVDASTFTLTGPSGAVPATVTYDDTSQTATLAPSSPLASSTTYSAHLSTGIHALDGKPLASAVDWSFTTAVAVPPQVVATVPAAGATDFGTGVKPRATFSRSMDPATLTASTFTLTGPAGAVAATVAYDSATLSATLTPSAPLTAGASYTARLAATVAAADGTPLGQAFTWSFTVPATPPAAPTVSAMSPAAGSTFVARSTTVTATFSRAMDPATVNGSTFALTGPSGAVTATVGYDAAANVATLTPAALLSAGTTYTAQVTTGAKALDGTPLASAAGWSFTTSACPCSLFSPVQAPAQVNLSTQDGRSGAGPFSYELGVKVTVDQAMQLTAIRFYKSSLETGTHIGRVWTSGGVQLGSVAFTGESASGWQQQALPTPLLLQAGAVYVISVNANSAFAVTTSGLATQIVSGPIRSVTGANGVFGSAAGTFPTQSYSSSNYFVDLSAVPDGDPAPPTVASTSPAAGATGVARSTSVTATFSRSMDPATISASTFTLTGPSGPVPASVAYDDTTHTATLAPAAALASGTSYTARLAATVASRDGKQLGTAVSWSFQTLTPAPLQVSSTVPAAGATGIAASVKPRATFSRDIDATTLTASSFTLTSPGGAVPATVAYDSGTRTATLTPNSALPAGVTYTARLAASVATADGASLGSAFTWSFAVSAAPAPFTVASTLPADAATGVARDGTVRVTFSRAADPATVTTSSFQLLAPGGAVVAASVAYDASSTTATLTPSSPLAGATAYTARLTTSVTALDGTALASAVTWSFTTSACPCSLFTGAPASGGNSTQDGRTGAGPWSYELGLKFTVSSAATLTSIRFYKDPLETGSHTGTIWSAGGAKLATVNFSSESASGWQQQALSTPLALASGTTYIVSVNANSSFGLTRSGLATAVTAGPLSSIADGANGVYGSAAGVLPTQSFSSSNYFVDVVVQ
jgi:hypothetical protein